MKRTLTFLFVWLTSVSLFAADVIVTKDSKSINAVITEVSKSEVKYKEVSKPDGPVFVLGVDEILTIVYENGTVQNFSEQSSAVSSSASENSSEQEFSQTDVIPTSGRITQKGDAYFINNVQIADNFTAVEKWISTNQANIYNDFKDYKKKASRMCTTGGVFLATGLVVGGVVGGTLLAVSEPGDDSVIAGAALLSAGSICLGIGVPLYVVGLVRSKNANLVSYYNEHAHSYSQTPLILELQSSQNGIGLALKF